MSKQLAIALLALFLFVALAAPAKADTVPVLLLHGCCGGTTADMNDVASALTGEGLTVYNLTIPSNTDPVANAWYVWSFVQANHLGQVDIVGYSMGGLSARYYIKNLGGNVRTLVIMDSPNAGDWFFCFVGMPLCPTSSFITSLNAGDQTPGSTFYVEIAANWFYVLNGGVCYLQTSGDHNAIPHRADVIGWTQTALAGVCPGAVR